MIAKTTLHIDGMTCINCETKIQKKLSNTGGVVSARVSYTNGSAVISFDTDKISQDAIITSISKLGYTAGTKAPRAKSNVLYILGSLFIILALYVIINQLGASRLFNSFPEAKSGMGYTMMFVIGLLTSVHCVAMCGGINLSQCVGAKNAGANPLNPSILYNLGRVISYTIVGAIVGALGSVISFSGAAKGFVAIVAGIFMVIMGLNMLNLFPWLRKLNPRMPKIFAQKIDQQKQGRTPLYVGLLNGLMPCGPLQAMQLYALSTGDPLKGAMAMFLFSMGTVPLMFLLGTLGTMLTKKFTSKLMTVSAVLVVVLGVFMFSNGMSQSGAPLPQFSTAKSQDSEQTDGVQIVTTKLSPNAYEPITVKVGVPVKWIIKAEENDINGCNNKIIIPSLNIEKEIVAGDNIIEFVPEKSGTIPYSCWMGMIKSKITIKE